MSEAKATINQGNYVPHKFQTIFPTRHEFRAATRAEDLRIDSHSPVMGKL